MVIAPSITLAKSGSTLGGPAPQTVTYTYAVKNTTTPGGIPDSYPALANVTPHDNLCAPLALCRRRCQR